MVTIRNTNAHVQDLYKRFLSLTDEQFERACAEVVIMDLTGQLQEHSGIFALFNEFREIRERMAKGEQVRYL